MFKMTVTKEKVGGGPKVDCPFAEKVSRAVSAGAVAVVIVNNDQDDEDAVRVLERAAGTPPGETDEQSVACPRFEPGLGGLCRACSRLLKDHLTAVFPIPAISVSYATGKLIKHGQSKFSFTGTRRSAQPKAWTLACAWL